MDDVLDGGRFDVISLGFVLALWSGSRALNVFVDTITIMHGLGGHRGIIRTRALSFVLYILAVITGGISIPLVVAGPTLVREWLPERADFVMTFYWPVVIVVCICFLATLYHVSVPVRTNWSFNLPGATFSLVAWVAGVLRPALGPHGHRGRLAVDLRPARRTDRRTHLALHRRARGTDRRGRQRRLRHGLPAEDHHDRAPRADEPAAQPDLQGPRLTGSGAGGR